MCYINLPFTYLLTYLKFNCVQRQQSKILPLLSPPFDCHRRKSQNVILHFRFWTNIFFSCIELLELVKEGAKMWYNCLWWPWKLQYSGWTWNHVRNYCGRWYTISGYGRHLALPYWNEIDILLCRSSWMSMWLITATAVRMRLQSAANYQCDRPRSTVMS